MLCPLCNMNGRTRASLHLFSQMTPATSSNIYATEQTTPLYRYLKQGYPNTVASEYLQDGTKPGETNSAGIRMEDLTQLTLASDSQDYVLSFEVLEHIPDYTKALKECKRVLRPGGKLVMSVPFNAKAAKTLTRARIEDSGELTHIEEPEYHGDPISNDGCLCFYHFGWDLLPNLLSLGFSKAEAFPYWSPKFGYMSGLQLLFVATV